jgi:hypothetical protein
MGSLGVAQARPGQDKKIISLTLRLRFGWFGQDSTECNVYLLPLIQG